MTKKYEMLLVGYGDPTPLYRLRALCDFGEVKAGDLGGYVDSESVLSHDGTCWIGDGSRVTGVSTIIEDAQVLNDCVIVNSRLTCRARVSQSTVRDSVVSGDSMVSGSVITDDCVVMGMSQVVRSSLQTMWLSGSTVVSSAVVGGAYDCVEVHNCVALPPKLCLRQGAKIMSDRDVFAIGPLGSRDARCVFVLNANDGDIWVNTGCFWGTLEKFSDAVDVRHKRNPRYRDEYRRAIDFAVAQLSKK